MNNRSIWDEIKWRYQTGGVLTRLIMINIGVFLAINIIRVTFMLMSPSNGELSNVLRYERIIQYIMVPSNPKILIRQFWSIFTHMFAHEGLLHILFNMLWMYWFGVIFKQFIGESKLLPTYILGGLTGALFFILAYNIFPAFSSLDSGYAIGASAAVTAIVVATAVMVPNYTMHLLFIGPVQLKWIAAVVVILDFISIPNGNAGGQIAHLGGAFYGFIYVTQYRNGNDLSKPFYAIWDGIRNFFDFSSKQQKKKKSKVKMAYKNDEKIRENRKSSSNKSTSNTQSAKEKQEKIDEILDKIGRSGYPSLTDEEKAFLFKYSKE